MPAPQASVMQALAKTRFQSFRYRLQHFVPRSGPIVPVGSGARFPASGAGPARAGVAPVSRFAAGGGGSGTSSPPRATPLSVPPALFLAASDEQADVNNQKDTSQVYETYIKNICSAICSAWSQWQSQARLTGVRINAAIATGGVVVGPSWSNLIKPSAPRGNSWYASRTDAIAEGIDKSWDEYQRSMKAPGLPWYPAFVAFPAPVAPPTPNVPAPVTVLGNTANFVTAAKLKSLIVTKFRSSEPEWAAELFDAIAFAFDACFKTWVASTMVTNVLGTGPIPTFAPPYVPAGPVIGGTGNMTPGGFV